MYLHVAAALAAQRLSHRARGSRSPLLRVARLPLSALYRAYSLWLLGMDIPTATRVGRGVRVQHANGLVVNPAAVIETGVTLRQNTTIGARRGDFDAPTLRRGADIGANVVIIGAVTIGAGARVGAGSVVLDDVAPGDVVVGNPARSTRRGALGGEPPAEPARGARGRPSGIG